MEIQPTDTEKPKEELKEERKFLKFLLRNKIVVILILLLFGVFFWAFIKMNLMERDFKIQKSVIVNTYELRIDSINLAKMELVSTVFSWAIRSELTRENMEQINEFFLNFIKVPDVEKVQLLNYDNSKILISTDKKDEGEAITNRKLFASDTLQYFKTDSDHVTYITPIMGLNKRIGSLVIKIKTNK